jgi:hypothetical protein
MLGNLDSTLVVSQSALEWIQHTLRKSTVRNAIAGIIWGKWTTERAEHWSIGIYDKETVEGWIVRCANLEFVVVQDFIVERLNGKTLRIDEHGVSVE